MPFNPRSPKYALLIPAVSAGIVGLVSAQSYEMTGHMRADVMGVTNGLMWFLAERFAWWVGVCYLERENQPDLTRRDWTLARAKVVQEERDVAREYATRVEGRRIAIGLDNGKHRTTSFHFPPSITLQHLTVFGDVIASGKPPSERKLKPTFNHEDVCRLRDWLMLKELNKFAPLAEYTNGRDEWDVNGLGRQLAIQWRCKSSPTPLSSSAIKYRVYSEQSKEKQLEQM